MNNFKFVQDFGITAWLCTITLLGVFIIIGMGVYNGDLSWDDLLPVLQGWVSAVLAAILVLKARKPQ